MPTSIKRLTQSEFPSLAARWFGMLPATNPIMIKYLPALLIGLSLFSSAFGESKPPNILFAIADDWGAHAGAYGDKWMTTPNFDRVADQGILFTNAYTPNAKCAPSRACILTGRNSWQLEEAANHWCYFPAKFKSWGEALAEHGWVVGHTQKGWAPGVVKDADGNKRELTGKAFNEKKATPPASGISNNDYAGNFDDFLNSAPSDKPWAFWYGSVEPHRGYEFGSGVSKGGKKISDIDKVPSFWPDNETVRNDMLDYAFEVEHFDNHLGRMLASLEKRGLLDNTLVIVTSDHGMPFPRGKGNAYEYSNHVPLAAMWKNGIAGKNRKVNDYISFIDLAPTFIELAGLSWKQTGMEPSPGKSLTNIFRTNKSGIIDRSRDHVLIGKERHDVGRPHDQGYPIRGIVKNSLLYIENFKTDRWPSGNPETGYLNVDGGATKTFILAAHRENMADPFWAICFGKRPAEEFYNLKMDTDCVVNLAGTQTLEKERKALKAQLEKELKAQKDPRMLGKGDVFDNYPYADPGGKDFYERFMKGDKPKAGWVSATDFEAGPLD
jgi:N-sulfoglucosamine sulfohydrolase